MALEETEVAGLLEKLDGSGSDEEWSAVRKLRMLGDELPRHLLGRFRVARKAGERAACVYFAIGHARRSEDAVRLGIEAAEDRSKVVRYRAFMLLAYSLRNDVLPELRRLRDAATATGGAPDKDLLAAIDAIEHQNSDYFVDRDHSGMVTMRVGES